MFGPKSKVFLLISAISSLALLLGTRLLLMLLLIAGVLTKSYDPKWPIEVCLAIPIAALTFGFSMIAWFNSERSRTLRWALILSGAVLVLTGLVALGMLFADGGAV